MIKAILMDLDGTLYDYDACNKISEDRLFWEIEGLFGRPEAQIRTLYDSAKKYVKERLGNTASSHNRLLYLQRLCELVEVNPLEYGLQLYDTYWNSMLGSMRLYDYFPQLAKYSKDEEIKLGIVTDLTAHIQYRKLKALGIDEDIDFIVTSEEAGSEKPDARLFHLALSKAKCHPLEAVMIGDSEERDIMGAEAMGIRAIRYDRTVDVVEEVKKII